MSHRERVYRTEAIVLRRTDFGEADRLLTVAGAVAPTRARTLAYEAVHPWITGMGVSYFETRDRALSAAH